MTAQPTRGSGHTTKSTAPASPMAPEPLARMSDLKEYCAALEHYEAGEWDDERWTAFRLRYGVYGQRQPGVQMIRIKIPGGILPMEWARVIARANREYAGAHIHITTRQDIQIYSVPLKNTPALLGMLFSDGVTTREACGNTLRNMTACMFSGACPREHVDAGRVADRLARMWIRHPLVQHMPRKFKVSVSGCATDCGAAPIHDMGLIAVERDGKKGFRVLAGGGLGGVPVTAVEVLPFAEEHELPAALEALARLHQRYSNRKNRNAARIKFVLRRFGEEKFLTLFREEFERVRAMPQRPWEALAWRTPSEAPEPMSPGGVFRQHDGKWCVVASPEIGNLSSDELEALADIAERHGVETLRTTREQNLAFMGVPPETVEAVIKAVRGLGIEVEETRGDVPDVITCPGTTTCRLGITNAPAFGREIVQQVLNDASLRELSVRISGCHNACGLHHVGDFGFHGMAKKLDGEHAPHYQIHIGGSPREIGAVGLPGPAVPARFAKVALELLVNGYAEGRVDGESVRKWALRIGKEGIKDLLAPVLGKSKHTDGGIFIDWGDDERFAAPLGLMGECAAPFPTDNGLSDLADDGLINLDRAIVAERPAQALESGRDAFVFAGRRLLARFGEILSHESVAVADDDAAAETIEKIRLYLRDDVELLDTLDKLIEARAEAEAGGDLASYREVLALWIDSVGEIVAKPVTEAALDVSRLGDFDTSVLDLIRSTGGSA